MVNRKLKVSIIVLLKLIYKVLIPSLLSFNIKRIKTAMMITKFEFVSYYHVKISKDYKKLLFWMFENSNYSTRKKMISNFYFSNLPTEYIQLFEEWSEKMKNNKNWKGSLNFNTKKKNLTLKMRGLKRLVFS